MTRRVYIGTSGMLMSVPGYEAGPGMPEAGKSFDSNWVNAAIVIARGSYVDPATAHPDGPIYTASSEPHYFYSPRIIANFRMIVFFSQATSGTVNFNGSDENWPLIRNVSWGSTSQASVVAGDGVTSIERNISALPGGGTAYQRYPDPVDFMILLTAG